MTVTWVPFDVSDAHEDPFVQFDRWFSEARDLLREPEAITLATVGANGRPSARLVLLRHHDAKSFGFFTNYESHKARDLAANPFAALVWYAEPLGRQIRIEGEVHKMAPAMSDAYFASRPRAHQIGAIASRQSRALNSREEIEQRVTELNAQYEGREIERPENWGGYELRPDHFEFWQHRADRLHDRVLYRRSDDGGWTRRRHAP